MLVGWLSACLAVLVLTSSGCEKKEPPAVEPWDTWPALMRKPSGTEGSKVTLESLAARAKTEKPMRPFREMPKPKAVERAERLLTRVARIESGKDESAKNKLDLLVPPVDWGKIVGNDVNAHAKRNEWRAIVPVVSAHFHTGDERYLGHLERVALDWIDYNLVKNEPNVKKWHDKPSGVRAAFLAYLIDYRLRSNPSDPALPKLVWAAARHAEELSKPEMLSSGNHGLYVVLGLKALVTALPELAHARKWGAYADAKMKQLLKTRYSREGFHYEHSPAYHEVTNKSVADILNTGLFDAAPGVVQKLQLARRVATQLYHPNGDRVMVGDSGRGPGWSQTGLAEQREFLRSGGTRGTAPASGLRAYPDVGYAIYRSPWSEKPFERHSYLFFAPGYHSRHHKHADHLSFEWSEAGQPILVDSGKYEYANSAWREFFMSTRAGNAIEIDGKDHEHLGESAWGGGLDGWGTLGALEFMRAQVKYEPSKVTHVRTLVLHPRKWLCLVDELSGNRHHTYRQWLHLHEKFEVDELGAGFVATIPDEMRVFIQPLAHDDERSLELERGQVKPRIQGWLSPSYRKKVKRYSLAFVQRGRRTRFVTLLSLDREARAAHVSDSNGRLTVEFSLGKERHQFRLADGKLIQD